jgi:HK97 family phage prohead protease
MRFAGYAAVFDRPDRGGDVIRKGAFAGSLERRGGVPLLWQHQPGAVIGRVEHLSEDGRGLRVIAELGGSDDAARAARLVRSGRLDGLSFGYRVRDAGSSGGLRELRDLDLVEVSLVAEPMQPRARVHAVE